MKKTIPIISIILSALMLLSVVPVSAAQAESVGAVNSVNTFITVPVAGNTPDFNVTKDNNECSFVTSVYAPHGTGLEFGCEKDGIRFNMNPTDTFERGKTYEARVYLTVSGTTFADNLTVTINGKKAAVTKINASVIYASYEFYIDAADYYVIGSQEVFGGAGWDVTGRTLMTRNSDGTYSFTGSVSRAFDSVPIKVAKLENGVKTVYGANGTNNEVRFAMRAAGSFYVTFNPSTGGIIVSGSGVRPVELEYNYIALAGNGRQSGFLYNEIWKADTARNKMSQVSPGVWEITYRGVKPGKGYAFQFLADGKWDNAFGGTYARNGAKTKAVYGGDQITFDVNTESDVTVRLDLSEFNLTTQKSSFTLTIKPKGFVPGDITGDGAVKINDATAVQRYLAKSMQFTSTQLKAADADGNGTVNINDATTIQKYVAQLIDTLG